MQPGGQRRALQQIEKTIVADDARLVARYDSFSRLSRREAMPRIERIPRWPRVLRLTRRVSRASRVVVRAGALPFGWRAYRVRMARLSAGRAAAHRRS